MSFASLRVSQLQASNSQGSLPQLPGYKSEARSMYKQGHHKMQNFKVRNGGPIEDDRTRTLMGGLRASASMDRLRSSVHADPSSVDLKSVYSAKEELLRQWDELDTEQRFKERSLLARTGSSSMMRSSASTASLRVEPSWVKHYRNVLRFQMYFKEAVHESATENFRVRKVTLFYYLTDQTVEITEPKIENSGLPHGSFLTRRQLVKDERTGELFSPFDFAIGNNVEIHSRVFHVVGCDSHTRAFFEANDVPLAPSRDFPEDPYMLYKSESQKKIKVESIAGSKAPDTLGMYLKHDRHVLRFKAVWDDSERLYGEVNHYTIHFFLADGSIEIRQVFGPNSGRDNFPCLLKRNKLQHSKEPRLYNALDLICGQFIHVYSRPILILNCDSATRKYYADVHGIEQKPVRLREEKAPVMHRQIPPYNGFGSEEDSLASCLNLIPKPVMMDLERFLKNRGKTLQFLAKFKDASPHDKDRRFVLSYYMDDDTLGIYEPPQRNSGIVGGKFLERARYKKPVKSKSNEGVANKFQLYLFEKIQSKMPGGPYGLKRAFRRFGCDEQGNIDLNNFRIGLRGLGVMEQFMDDDAIEALFNSYDSDGSGTIDYHEFVEHVMMDKPKAVNESKGTSRWLRASDFYVGSEIQIVFPRTGAVTQTFVIMKCDSNTLKLMEDNPDDFPKSNVELISATLARVLHENGVRVRNTFKNIDLTGRGYITTDEFVTLLQKWAKDFGFVDDELSMQEAMTLVRHFDKDNDGTIHYSEFCDALLSKSRPSRIRLDLDKVADAKTRVFEKLRALDTSNVRHSFRSLDKDNSGNISFAEFWQMLFDNQIDLAEDEQNYLLGHFDKDGNGVISYEEFCDALIDEDETFENEGKSEEKLSAADTLTKAQRAGKAPTIGDYNRMLHESIRQDDPYVDLCKLMKQFSSTFSTCKKQLLSHMMKFDLNRRNTIARNEFREALDRTNSDYPSYAKQTLLNYLFPEVDSEIHYQEFLTMMFSQNINSCVAKYGLL